MLTWSNYTISICWSPRAVPLKRMG